MSVEFAIVLLECYSMRGFVRKHLYLLGKGIFAGSANRSDMIVASVCSRPDILFRSNQLEFMLVCPSKLPLGVQPRSENPSPQPIHRYS